MKDVAGDAVFHSTNQDSKLQVCFISSFFYITKPQTRLFKIIVRNPVIARFQSHCGSLSSS